MNKMQLEGNPAECGRYLSYLYRRSGTQFSQFLKPYGFSATQSILLIGVYRHEGTNQQSLADQISMDTGVASRVLRELEDGGYIEKKRNEQNRRNYNIFLTDKGREMAECSLSMQLDYWTKLIQDFPPDEVAILNSLLEKMDARSRELPVG